MQNNTFRSVEKRRSSIEPGLKNCLTEIDNHLSPFFSVENLKFEVKNADSTLSYEKYPIVYCNDIEGLVKLLVQINVIIPENQLVKIAIDGGGGSIKFCMNILDLENKFETEIKRKKWSYSNIKSDNYKDNSVLSSILILVAPDIPERYFNMELLFKKLSLEKN